VIQSAPGVKSMFAGTEIGEVQKVFGRKSGERPKSGRVAPRVLQYLGEGRSYRTITKELCLSKNTVMSIVQRDRSENGNLGRR